MDENKRRDLLSNQANPETKIDYVVTLKGRIGTANDARQAVIRLRYVPDRWIVPEQDFKQYLDALADTEWTTLEALATLILHDLNNQVVARWVQVTASKAAATQGSERLHTVTIEDRQPNWDNPDLLARV